jgi:hypothetical protein
MEPMMRYQVVMRVIFDGREVDGVEYVEAPSKGDAEVRASVRAENKGQHIIRIKAVRPAA